MKMFNAFILYALLLLLLRRVDSTSTAQPWRSFLSKTTNNNDPVIPKTVIDSDTSNFHDNMSLMNYTKFLLSKKETTTQSVTDEAEYNEWGEQGPRFILDVITTPAFTTKNDMQSKSSILDYDKEHLMPYSGNQEETVKKPNVEGREQLITLIPDLKHKETYSLSTYKTTENSYHETDIDGPPNQNARFHETFEKMFLKSEELSPPWIKYGPMQSRNEAGQKIVHNNLSDQFRFPETRDRWWWEYEMHYMHWFFWHCEHWMIHWEINPPNPLLNNSKQEVYQDNESYRNSLENKTYTYCIWLLQDKHNQTNTEDDNILSTVNGSVRSADGKVLRQFIEIAGPVVCQCYHCGYYDIEQEKQHRICHRAFTDRNYFKFQKWIKAKCRESPTKKGRHYYRSVLYDDGTIDVWGFYLKNMCVTYYSDIGELYTVRDCMKLLPYRRAWFPIAYLQKVYYALDETLRATKQLGCVATPYSFHAPFSRSRPGLFVRSYACLCQGSWCNSSSRVQNFIGLPCTILFYIILFVDALCETKSIIKI